MLARELIDEAARRYGTPLYLYDLGEVRTRARELHDVLPRGSRLLYSLKANPLPPLAALLAEQGCDAEVSSSGELTAALAAGFPAERIMLTGPGKTEAEIEQALAAQVRLISCESGHELRRIERVAGRLGCLAEILLRIQPVVRASGLGLSMADGRQFGLEEPDAADVCRDAARSLGVRVRGFHVFQGSQLPDPARLNLGFGYAMEAIERVMAKAGMRAEVADLGGGFPWPYAAAGEGCPLGELAGPLAVLAARAAPAQLWFESGRRLCGSAGVLVTSVMDVKRRSEGAPIVVTDAGINALGGMSGLGRVMRPAIALEPLYPGGTEPEVADVVGPSCTPLDRLAVAATLPVPAVGDLLVVPNAGAYGLTASLIAFLSRPPPLELVYDSGRLAGIWQIGHGHRAVQQAPG